MYMFVRHMWSKGETVLVKSHYVWCPLLAVVLITLSVACTCATGMGIRVKICLNNTVFGLLEGSSLYIQAITTLKCMNCHVIDKLLKSCL